MRTDIQEFYDNFGQAMTGDLRWVLMALIVLTLGSIYAASISSMAADELENED